MEKIALQSEIESIIPVLFNVAGSRRAVEAAQSAAIHLLDLIDASADNEIDNSQPIDDETMARFRVALMADNTLTKATRQVAGVILDHVDPASGYAQISSRQIVRLSGLGLNSPIRAIRALRKAGWLRVIRSATADERRGVPNRYVPNVSKITE